MGLLGSLGNYEDTEEVMVEGGWWTVEVLVAMVCIVLQQYAGFGSFRDQVRRLQ